MASRRLLAVVWGLLALAPGPARAAERDFAFTWTSHVLERGRDDLEVWLTPRIARAAPGDTTTELRFVWTHGVVRHLEAQLSLDTAFLSSDRAQPAVDPRLTSLWRWAPFRADGPVGLALLGRASLGPDAFDVEARVIADAQLGDTLLAVNAAATQSFLWNGRDDTTTRVEGSFGAAYAVAPFARVGLEVRPKASWARGAYQGTALYVGPSLAFRFKPVWFALSATAQVAAHQAEEDRGPREPLALRDDERFVLRFTFGFPTDD